MEAGLKKTLVIGGVVLATTIVLVVVGNNILKKVRLKKEAERQKELEEEIKETSNQQQQTLEQQQATSYNPSADMKLLEGWILGANVIVYPEEVNGLIQKLTDSKLRKLAGAWKTKHKRTLYFDLDDEYDQCGWWFDNCYESSMKRLSSLGLR